MLDQPAGRPQASKRQLRADHVQVDVGKQLLVSLHQAEHWPRTRVIHMGYTGHDDEAARRAENIVSVALDLMNRMDHARRR